MNDKEQGVKEKARAWAVDFIKKWNINATYEGPSMVDGIKCTQTISTVNIARDCYLAGYDGAMKEIAAREDAAEKRGFEAGQSWRAPKDIWERVKSAETTKEAAKLLGACYPEYKSFEDYKKARP